MQLTVLTEMLPAYFCRGTWLNLTSPYRSLAQNRMTEREVAVAAAGKHIKTTYTPTCRLRVLACKPSRCRTHHRSVSCRIDSPMHREGDCWASESAHHQ